MKNYAGHRLSPWLGHLMISRTETARALLTPGEVMQLPPDDEIVMVAGLAPIRARKARYFLDARFRARIVAPPDRKAGPMKPHDWARREGAAPAPVRLALPAPEAREQNDSESDTANSGIRQEPELPAHEDVAPPNRPMQGEFDYTDDDAQGDAARARAAADRRLSRAARNASVDPGDGIDL